MQHTRGGSDMAEGGIAVKGKALFIRVKRTRTLKEKLGGEMGGSQKQRVSGGREGGARVGVGGLN